MEFIHPPFYDNYVNSVTQPIPTALNEQEKYINNFLAELKEDQLNFRYAPEKWTLKELLLHCLDVERIMAMRLLMISRGEMNSLLGFNENEYVEFTESDFITLEDIKDDFYWLRKSNINLLKMLPEHSFDRVGSVDYKPMTVASLWSIIVGHWNHHINIINERYL